MLNTKPIKKNFNSLDNHITNQSSDIKNSNRVIKLSNSRQEELVKMIEQANIESNIGNEQKGGIGNDVHTNIHIQNIDREFTNDRYIDKNLNVNNLIDGNKIFNGNVEKKNINNNGLIFNDIQKVNDLGEPVKVNWNDIDNCYIISNTFSGEVINKVYNEKILKYIIECETNDISIKKYLLIVSLNNQNDNYEFNFIDSVFTSNFDIMIKLQNFIYDILKNFDNLEISDTYNYYEIILMFYFQLIIYLFNNYEKYLNNNDNNKVSRIYSSIVYRFSSLILKSILKIKNSINSNNVILNDLMLLRSNIFSQINLMNDKIEQMNYNTDIDSNIDSENNSDNYSKSKSKISIRNTSDSYLSDDSSNYDSNKSKNSKRYHIINNRKLKKTTDTYCSSVDSDKNTLKFEYFSKNGKKKIKDLLTDEIQIDTNNFNSDDFNKNYDSDVNGYFEINEQLGNYNINNKNNLANLLENEKLIIPVENSVISNIKSYTTGSKDRSYNPNSALKNSKIFKIQI